MLSHGGGPVTETGDPITADNIRHYGVLVAQGRGRYAIEINGYQVPAKNGDLFILDLSKLAQRLASTPTNPDDDFRPQYLGTFPLIVPDLGDRRYHVCIRKIDSRLSTIRHCVPGSRRLFDRHAQACPNDTRTFSSESNALREEYDRYIDHIATVTGGRLRTRKVWGGKAPFPIL